ncbi:MAG: TonB-dependent receptor [Desulfobacterales bacterium]|nr:MAG: TonB-dependent receptor [Desulfobacterales bacterium]
MGKKICMAIFSALLAIIFPSQPLLAAEKPAAENVDPLSLYFDRNGTEQTTTRVPKPLSQVAENVSIITAEEIAAMHAHTLGEVLDRQAGMFISFFGRDFFSNDVTRILASRQQHALFLMDGVRINLNSNGMAVTNFIPLTIIQRIEIIKGPASSSWGSSLGGVVNIITKDVGGTATPTGSVNASYGEAQSRDVSAEVAGGGGRFGYYLSGGNIDSNGLKVDRYAERDTAYGKLQVQLPHNSTLTAAAGYSDPFYKTLNWGDAWIDGLNLYEEIDHRNFWGTLFFDTQLTNRLSLHLAVQRFENDFARDRFSLGTGLGARGDLITHDLWEDTYTGFASRLSWAGESLTANIGFESSRSRMDNESTRGSLPPWWGPAIFTADPEREERRGLYANATLVLGRFSLTPGLRYDYNGNSEEFVSPSLGATCQLAADTLLRASVARGFSAPYLAASTHSPDLKPETIWAYQAGVETGRIPYILLKCTLFHQKVDDAWYTDSPPWPNAGTIRWNGVELEAATVEYHGLRLTTNFTFVTEDSMGDGTSDRENDETYTANVILDYQNHDHGWRAELAGHYYWMNEAVKNEKPKYDDFLWDALLSKDFTLAAVPAEVYVKAHNIFNASQYFDFEYPNPYRWVEAGIVLRF